MIDYLMHVSLSESAANFTDWKKCDAAANVIAHCPRHLVSPDEYYAVISSQVSSLQCTKAIYTSLFLLFIGH
jgi:hypothetical protein